MEDLAKKIESILFYQSEPMKLKKIAEILGTDLTGVETGLNFLEKQKQNSGIKIIRDSETVALVTAPENSDLIEKIKREEQEKELSRAALETLTIILYCSPIKKSEIDYIRGVNSQFSLRSLLIKGLIEKEVNKNDERSYVYRPTLDLISYLGILKISELPDFQRINDNINRFMTENKNKESDEIPK